MSTVLDIIPFEDAPATGIGVSDALMYDRSEAGADERILDRIQVEISQTDSRNY